MILKGKKQEKIEAKKGNKSNEKRTFKTFGEDMF